MSAITISIVFNQSGSGFINVIPSTYPQWDPKQSSSQDYDLAAGDYSVTYLTNTGNGGAITVTENGNELASSPLKANDDGGNLDITVS